MSPTQKHLLHFEGGNALSAFRAQALLPKLQSVSSRVTGVAARHVHWVWTDSQAQPDAIRKLGSLLRYGDEYAGATAEREDTALVVAMPRLGTVSPWASKATDIAHHCGLDAASGESNAVSEYTVLTDQDGLLGTGIGGKKALSDASTATRSPHAAARPHDRERVAPSNARHAVHLFDKQPAEPLQCTSTCWARAAPRWKKPTASWAWRCPTTKSTTWSTRSRAWNATRPTSS